MRTMSQHRVAAVVELRPRGRRHGRAHPRVLAAVRVSWHRVL